MVAAMNQRAAGHDLASPLLSRFDMARTPPPMLLPMLAPSVQGSAWVLQGPLPPWVPCFHGPFTPLLCVHGGEGGDQARERCLGG